MYNKTIDITKINLQNESLKLKNKKVENGLLLSITEKGIHDPLLGFFSNNLFILVDGFKRYRCCKKLHIYNLPISEIALDEANAFIKTLRISNSKSLHVLEQAKFIKGLQDNHNMTIRCIAASLDRSVNWVSIRLTLLKDLTPLLEEKIFKGYFPVWNATGVLHQFKRSNIASNAEIDSFVKAVSGKKLSVKDVDLLANGYFKGGNELKKQIENGNFSWSVNKLKERDAQSDVLNDKEKTCLKDLEITSKYIGRIIFKLPSFKNNNNFYSTGGLLAEGILNKLNKFQQILTIFIEEVENDQQ